MISGRMRIKMDDGSEEEFGPGDVSHIPPGHNAWVVGNEPCSNRDRRSDRLRKEVIK